MTIKAGTMTTDLDLCRQRRRYHQRRCVLSPCRACVRADARRQRKLRAAA